MSFLKRLRSKKRESRSYDLPTGSRIEPAVTISEISETEKIVACTTNEAFREAWTIHFENLSAQEKAIWCFKETVTPLRVQKTVENWDKQHKERSVTRRIAEKTLRFLRALENLMAGAVIGIQQYPDVSSIIIGVLRVVINIAVKYFEYYEKLTDMLERLSDQLEIYDIFAKKSEKEPVLHKTLVVIYSNVLAFCKHARSAFVNLENANRQSSLSIFAKVQWAPFEEQFGKIQSDLEHNSRNLDRVTAAITLNSTMEIHEEMIKELSPDPETERTDFLNWISAGDCQDHHESIRQKRYGNTGSWLLDNNIFKEWISDGTSKLLWCHGQAGIGKSVLASVVVDHFMRDSGVSNCTIAYIYFKGEDAHTQHLPTPTQVLSMLIAQLCWNLNTLPLDVLKSYREMVRNARKPQFKDLQNILIECARSLSKVVLVFDGVDECEEFYRKQILQFICTVGAHCANVKVFVTSRWMHDIAYTFSRLQALKIEIGRYRVIKDLAEVVRHRVETDLEHISRDLQLEVMQILTEKSSGMFLWVDLQLNDLSKVQEPDIKRQLEMLPTGLDGTYLRIFQRMSRLPQTSRLLAQRCFLWAFHTKILISSDKFIDAVSLEHKISGNKFRYKARDLEKVTFKLLTIEVFGFVRVRPVHFSVQEFFEEAASKAPAECQDFFPESDIAQSKLATMCLQHLLVDAPPAELLDSILTYCASYFDSHIRSLKTIPGEVIEVLDQLIWKEPEKLRKILAFRFGALSDRYPDLHPPGNPESIDPNFFLKSTKLDHVPQLWSRYADPDIEKRPYPESYLHIASFVGLESVVLSLVSQGANVNRVDTDRLSPLHVASLEDGHIGTLRILLAAGADWNLDARDVPSDNPDEYEPPLVFALRYTTNPAVIDCFLNGKTFNFATCMRSLKEDEVRFVKKLLDRGADVNQRDEHGKTAVEIARELKFSNVAELLLERGAGEDH